MVLGCAGLSATASHSEAVTALLQRVALVEMVPAVLARAPDEGAVVAQRSQEIRYTVAMKAAVSLPDPLFEAADALAKRLGMSRSELVAAALEAYLRSHRQAEVTEKLNEIYHDEDSSLDPVIAAIQSASLGRDEW